MSDLLKRGSEAVKAMLNGDPENPESIRPICAWLAEVKAAVAATPFDTPAWQTLLREVIGWHADPDSRDYKGCDKWPCDWCERAKVVIEEARHRTEADERAAG